MQHVDEGLLVAYADGALAAGSTELADVTAHLASCGTCRARVAEEQALAARSRVVLARATPAPQAQPAFEELLRRRQQTTAGTPAKPARRAVPLAWAASVVLALGAGWMARTLLMTPDFAATELQQQAPQPQRAAQQPATAPAPESPERALDAVSPEAGQAEEAVRVRAAEADVEAAPPPAVPESGRERRERTESAASAAAPAAAVGAAAAPVETAPSAPPHVTQLQRRPAASTLRDSGAAAGDLAQKSVSATAEALAVRPQPHEAITAEHTWERVTMQEARARYGQPIALAPGAATDSVFLGRGALGTRVVWLHQTLPNGERIELVEWPESNAEEAPGVRGSGQTGEDRPYVYVRLDAQSVASLVALTPGVDLGELILLARRLIVE